MKRFVILVYLLWLAAPAWAQTGQESAVIAQVEADGWFRRCQTSDLRGCALFTREVIRRLNPTGDPGSWGWLSKSGGEENADGYSVDAMVWTADAGNLRNVVDIIGGAGGGNPRAGMGGFVQRRPSNQWVRPVPLSAADAAYACMGACAGTQPQPPTPPQPQPPQPPPPPDYSEALAQIQMQLDNLGAHLAAQGQQMVQLQDELAQTRAVAADLAARVSALSFTGSISLPGFLGGTRGITLEQPK